MKAWRFAATALCSAMGVGAQAQTVLKIGYTPAASSHYGVGSIVLCDEIEKGTQGRYKCQQFPNGSHIGEREMMEAVQQDTVDGQENPIPVILASKLSQVQKHLSSSLCLT